jgi:phenylpropionate dioxygenase-like ring-hydroxylating dioxygenase large terminal subunit
VATGRTGPTVNHWRFGDNAKRDTRAEDRFQERMMSNDTLTMMYEAVEREVNRTAYPEDFPALPEMPSARYFDPEFYALEMEHVFKKTWLSAAHISELPKPGSYKLFEQFGLSIIISRGTDDVVRAFRNVCRHRGAALVTEPAGTARRFVCPYHAWGYSSEGKLVSVPEAHNFACLDKADRPLLQVRCETWRGFIFINLDDNADPLDAFMAPLTKQIADFPLDDMIVKDVITVELDCNWKTSYDNFLEIYHVNTVHAKSLAPYLESKSFAVSLLKNGHARFATRKRSGKSFFSDGADEQEPDDFTTRFKEHAIGLPFFPNGFTALDPVGFSWQTFWPAGPNKMVMIATMMGWKKDDEEDRAFWAQMRVNQIDVLNEDTHLFGSIQRAMETGELPGILLGYQEQQIYWYNEQIDARIGAENIPPHLRVKPLLAALASE